MTIDSCWITCGEKVFDATDFLRYHPGGVSSILRYSGGRKDCSEDMKFHSKEALKLLEKKQIGVLCNSKCEKTKKIELFCDGVDEMKADSRGCSIS